MSKSKFNLEAVKSTISLLCETYPECFHIDGIKRKPLAIGVHTQILEQMGGAITKEDLADSLRHYTSDIGYLRNSCIVGIRRIGLDGTKGDAVTEKQREHYVKMVEAVYTKWKAQKKAKRGNGAVQANGNDTDKAPEVAPEIAPVTVHPAQPAQARLSLSSLRAAGAVRRARELADA
jgi:sRNA-binding protein